MPHSGARKYRHDDCQETGIPVSTGLRYCAETTLGVLPAAASQFWYPAEPNTYSDFGGIGSRPSLASRSMSRARIAKASPPMWMRAPGYNTDMTATNLLRLMQGFLFADAREAF